jgi:hypothetical protein
MSKINSNPILRIRQSNRNRHHRNLSSIITPIRQVPIRRHGHRRNRRQRLMPKDDRISPPNELFQRALIPVPGRSDEKTAVDAEVGILVFCCC